MSGRPLTASPTAILLVLAVVSQRFALPGTPIPLLLVLVLVWVAVALVRGYLEPDPTRLTLWTAAAAATGLVALIQSALGSAPISSITSWGFFLATWFPLAFRLRRAETGAYVRFLIQAAHVGVALACACIVMMLLQWAGLPYVDLLGETLPRSLLLQEFNTNNPVAYGSTLIKANAWIGLEPSIVSFQLGVFALAALIAERRFATVLLVTAMVVTFSGSGFIVLMVGVAVLAVRRPQLVLPYVVPLVIGFAAFALTPFRASLLGRVFEFSEQGSSGSLRAVEPYSALWPLWNGSAETVLLGRGPGSSQVLVDATGVYGLIVTIPIKVFFDYGILAGSVLALYLVSCHLGSPGAAVSLALFVGCWSIQPAATLVVLIILIGLFSSFWTAAESEDAVEELPHRADDEARRRRARVSL